MITNMYRIISIPKQAAYCLRLCYNHTNTTKSIKILILIPFSYFSLLPGDEAAVMDNAVLHIHSSLFMCVYRPVVMAPAQSDGGVLVGRSALQWESVTPEH